MDFRATTPGFHPGPPSTLGGRLQVFDRRLETGGGFLEAVLRPHPALADEVEMLWYSHGRVPGHRDRILPRGRPHLLINLGRDLVQREVEARGTLRGTLLAGQQPTFVDLEAPEGITLLGVAFTCTGAYALDCGPQDQFFGAVAELGAVLGDRQGHLAAELRSLPGPEARLARVEAWLLNRRARRREVHPAVRWAARRLESGGGVEPIASLVKQSGYSHRHFSTLFRRQVGLVPKGFARIQRFHRALRLLRAAEPISASFVAHDCGYYDQAHLCHDLQAMAGLAPGELRKTPEATDRPSCPVHRQLTLDLAAAAPA